MLLMECLAGMAVVGGFSGRSMGVGPPMDGTVALGREFGSTLLLLLSLSRPLT